VLFLLLIVSFYVLLVCKCVMYYCHRVSAQLQFTNISFYIISYESNGRAAHGTCKGRAVKWKPGYRRALKMRNVTKIMCV